MSLCVGSSFSIICLRWILISQVLTLHSRQPCISAWNDILHQFWLHASLSCWNGPLHNPFMVVIQELFCLYTQQIASTVSSYASMVIYHLAVFRHFEYDDISCQYAIFKTVELPQFRNKCVSLRWFHVLRCFYARFASIGTFAYLHGSRVGEASHPGPKTSFAVINPAALYGKTSDVESLNADVVICSETSVTKASRRVLEKEFSSMGWKSFWSQEVGNKIDTLDGRPSLRGESIGTAILTKIPARTSRTPIAPNLWETCRICTSVVRVDNIEILVIALYGFPANNKGREVGKMNDILLACALDIALSSGMPYVIGGDINSQPQSLPIYAEFKRHGAIDAFELSRLRFGKQLDPTCRGATYNDTMILHPFLAQRVSNIAVTHNHAFTPHSPMVLQIDMTVIIPPVLKWDIPKSWVPLAPHEENIEYFYKTTKHSFLKDPSAIRSVEDGQVALEQWSKAIEHSVDRTLSFQNRVDPVKNPISHLPHCYRGRCLPRKLVSTSHGNSVKSDAYHHYDPEQEVFSVTNRHKVRQVRRLKSLIQSIESSHRNYHSSGILSNQTCTQHHNEWCAILRARGYGNSWQKWILSFEPISFISQTVPDLEYLKMMAKITELDCDAACAQENTRRKAIFKRNIRIDDTENFGSFTYKIMREKETPKLTEVPAKKSTMATLQRKTKGRPCCVILHEHVSFLTQHRATFGNAEIQIVEQADRCVYFHVINGVIPTSGLLSQSYVAITPDEICQEFKNFWTPKWMRDPVESQFDESYWEPFLQHLASLDIPQMSVEIKLDDIDEWMNLIKRLPDRKVEGACGWRYEELKLLSKEAIKDLADIVQGLWQYGFSRTMMCTRVSLLAKVLTPKTINDARPITIMSVLVRIVSKLVFSQTVKVWMQHLPQAISGGLPNRGVRDLALDQALEIESCLSNRQGLCGSSVDLVKAFNLIPRLPLAKIFERLGLQRHTIRFWCLNLSRLTRYPTILGSLGVPVASSTGIPEGASWSVLGMLALSAAFYYTLARPNLKPYTFADNWSWMTTSAKQNFQAWIRLLNLTSSLSMSIDYTKSWVWGTTKSLKNEIQNVELLFPGEPCEIMIKGEVKDLGEVVVYSKRAWIQPIVSRIADGVKRIHRIAWIPLDIASKCHKIQMGALSMALYGADRHFVGKSHFHSLRSAVCDAVIGHRVYASPWLVAVILSKYYQDPQLTVILSALKTFHRLWFRDRHLACKAFRLGASSSSKNPFGPATTLVKYLSSLDLSLVEDGSVWYHEKFLFHIGKTSQKDFCRIIQQYWDIFVTQQVQHRRGLSNHLFDFTLTQRVFEALDPKHQKLIRMNMVGGFQTKIIQSKWSSVVSDKCPLCDQVEDQQHVILKCCALQRVRDRHDEACKILTFQRPQWIYHPIAIKSRHLEVVREALDAIQPFSDIPCIEHTNSNLRFYTDGSCTDPAEPSFRRASWAVIGDCSPNEDARSQACASFSQHSGVPHYFSCLATGHVHGCQSIARAELLACTVACRIACNTDTCQTVDIFTDSQYVLNVIWLIEHHQVQFFVHKMANPDLVEELTKFWNCKIFRFHKVTSHRTFESATSFDDLWNIIGNSIADRAAVRALGSFPTECKDLIASLRSYRTCETHRLTVVLQYLVDLNTTRLELLKNVETKTVEPCQPTDSLKTATGELALQAMISYSIPQPVFMVEGSLDMSIVHAYLMGSHLAVQFWTWLSMLQWPPEHEWKVAPACWGVSFLELVINFSQCSGVAFPIAVSGKGCHTEYAGYFSEQARMLPVSKRSASHQTMALSKAIQTMQTLTKQKVFPVLQRKGCFSARRLGYVGDALGLPVRPVMPLASRTMTCVQNYLNSLTGKGLHPALPDPPDDVSLLIQKPTFPEPGIHDRFRAYWRLVGK